MQNFLHTSQCVRASYELGLKGKYEIVVGIVDESKPTTKYFPRAFHGFSTGPLDLSFRAQTIRAKLEQPLKYILKSD